MIERFAETLVATDLHGWIISSSWVWAAAEIFHFAGLCLVLGAIAVVDLVLMGVLPAISMREINRLLKTALLGFSINFFSGVLFVVGDPHRYFSNISFQIKIFLIIVVGVNAIYYFFSIKADERYREQFETDLKFRVVGCASLIIWILVVVCGRLIPYVE